MKKEAQKKLRKEIYSVVRTGPLKLGIGSGPIRQDGWISSDLDGLDIRSRADWAFALGRRKVTAVVAEHVFEHLSLEDGRLALRNCYEFMSPGGHIRIAVPDGLHANQEYVDYVRPGGSGPGSDDHKVLYTRESLEDLMRSVGFRTYPLEYWDSNRSFRYVDWASSDGMIRRSFLNDKRNADGEPHYTSLIIDGIRAAG